MNRTALLWLAVGWIGFAVLPWHAIDDGFWSFAWLDGYPLDIEYAPAVVQVFLHDRYWLLPVGLTLIAPLFVLRRTPTDTSFARILMAAGAFGLVYTFVQGFAIGIGGWQYGFLESAFGPMEDRQFGMGYGAILALGSFLFMLTQGIAARGAIKGDVFVVGSIGMVVALVSAFIIFPVSRILLSAVQDDDESFAPALFLDKFFSNKIWGLDCLTSNVGCGVAWNSLVMGILVGAGTTALGLAFALIATRTSFRAKKLLRVLTVLPIVTPPFVIGLAIILLFGRSGAVSTFLEWSVGIEPSRWIYGLPGIFFAQMLAFTPIAFLVMIGVVEGISPSMEEAALTLRADNWQTFAIVGAQNDQGRAAVLAIVLLSFTLSAFYAQRRWLGRKSYATVTGKGDAGIHIQLPNRLKWLVYGTALPWALLTGIIYVMIMFGGFVETWGFDHSFTLRHYIEAFDITSGSSGLIWSGTAWNSFWTTLEIAAISAPLTAALGLLTAYLLVRQQFLGKDAFEFGTMLSFAIPGTVIGISYILAFNVPPMELTGSGAILVVCFVFRNMPVGVRAGIAAMSQIDRSLDEASLTLGAKSFTTLRKVVLPLVRPAIVAALVFSFVRAMTAISAVIFLVSAEYDMATSYIIGRVENNDYGLAIAYSSVLILVMLCAIVFIQVIVGKRVLSRREAQQLKLEGNSA